MSRILLSSQGAYALFSVTVEKAAVVAGLLLGPAVIFVDRVDDGLRGKLFNTLLNIVLFYLVVCQLVLNCMKSYL